MQQMPEEGRKFKTVDRNWKDIMNFVCKDPKVNTDTAFNQSYTGPQKYKFVAFCLIYKLFNFSWNYTLGLVAYIVSKGVFFYCISLERSLTTGSSTDALMDHSTTPSQLVNKLCDLDDIEGYVTIATVCPIESLLDFSLWIKTSLVNTHFFVILLLRLPVTTWRWPQLVHWWLGIVLPS